MIFFHIDVNSAFLSWSAVKRLQSGDTVDLRTIPAIIGGDQEKRHGIVLAKSIPCKPYGIQTAEPIVNAYRKCPTLVMEPPDFATYNRQSNNLMNYLKTYTPDIEQASIDECYMDFTPIAYRFSTPIEAADRIREEVYEKFGFTVNIGISDKKVLAKMASDFQKPNRTHTLFTDEIEKKMWPLPVGDLFLCGKSAQDTLRKLGINTIGELAKSDVNILTAHLKSHGKTLWEFANGIDDSRVETVSQEAKGIGNSTTGDHDITQRSEAVTVLQSLSESVSARMHKSGFRTSLITVEIKYATFQSVSKQGSVPRPISTSRAIHEEAVKLFDILWTGEPIRLLGVRATKLTKEDEPEQLSLFDEVPMENEKQRAVEKAMEEIRSRFGKDSIRRGSDQG